MLDPRLQLLAYTRDDRLSGRLRSAERGPFMLPTARRSGRNVHLAGLKGPRLGCRLLQRSIVHVLAADGIPISTSVAPGIQFMAAQML